MENVKNEDGTEEQINENDFVQYLAENAAQYIREVTGWGDNFGLVIVIGTPDGKTVSSSNLMSVSALDLAARYLSRELNLHNVEACARRQQEEAKQAREKMQ